MAVSSEPSNAARDAAEAPGHPTFGGYYYRHDCGEPYERNERWLDFFRNIAERIETDLAPMSVLDAGCALGMLVETLRERDIDASGFDISQFAVEHAHESVRDHVWQASLIEPIKDHYDLVVCVEVIEHMPPEEAEAAVANLCAAGDRVLFSSSPHDFSEATHLNVQPPESWSALFAKNGFFRNLDFDASFLTPWAVLYERAHRTVPDVVRLYDGAVARLQEEVHAVRANILNLHAYIEHLADMSDEVDRLRELTAEQHKQIEKAHASFEMMEERATDMEARVLRVYRLPPVRAYSWVLKRLHRLDPDEGAPGPD